MTEYISDNGISIATIILEGVRDLLDKGIEEKKSLTEIKEAMEKGIEILKEHEQK